MPSYLIGADAKEITPPADLLQANQIFLWGFGSRTDPATGVRDAIWSRVLVIADENGTCVVLVSLDLCALDPAFTQAVRNRVAQSRGLPSAHITINVTHTHSAPVTVAIPTWNPGVDTPDPDYMAFLENQVVAAIEEAFDCRQPARLAYARGKTNIGHNRHFGAGGAYDRTLDVLRATDEAGDTIAVAFFHGCHPILYEQRISSDYPGVAREVVEQFAGGVAIFCQGYGGTINPIDASDIVQTGQQLGNDVITLLRGPLDELTGSVAAFLSTIEIPLQPLDPLALEQAKTQGDFNLKRWANHIAAQGANAPDTLPVQLQSIRIGTAPDDWYLVASSHEVVAEFSEPVRAIWPYDRVTLIGYSNGQMSYLPTKSVLADPPCSFPFCQNYEGGASFTWYGHRAPVTESVDELFMSGNIELLDPGWKHIGHAQEVVAMTALNGKLFAATQRNELWWRDPVSNDVPWQLMGHADSVVGMAALNGYLFAATADGKLWRRPLYGYALAWEPIGHAQEVVAMTALNGKLFAATQHGQLWWRDPVSYDVPWEHIGLADLVVGMAAARGKLIVATQHDQLWWRDPVSYDVPWHRFGDAEHVVGMAALNDTLFVATREGSLWRRDV